MRSAADGKLSFYDMAYCFGLSRQRIEGFVTLGRQVIDTLTPVFANIDVEGDGEDRPATKRLGSPTLFTHTLPVSHTNKETGETTRICICCETRIEADDDEVVLAYLDRSEVAWCSRECAREMPIDAYLVANRYKRHWVDVALAKDEVDERSRVREITPVRMEALAQLAKKQGY